MDPGPGRIDRTLAEIRMSQGRYREAIADMIAACRELGVILKDPDKGLCDFPYMRKGRMVYLCWQLGEETIGYWHHVESGFAGREQLDDSDR